LALTSFLALEAANGQVHRALAFANEKVFTMALLKTHKKIGLM